jgi:MFS family permease
MERNVKDYARIARKITNVLFMSQSLSSAGFIAAFTVNGLVGVDLSGQRAMAGVPGAAYVSGQACGALIWGLSMERIGRRGGLALGQVIGVIGSVIAMGAVIGRSFSFFLVGLVLVGIARSAVDLGRFAAAEVHLPSQRGRAISRVVLGSTVGAVVGPLLVGPTGSLAQWAGFPELMGPYGVGFVGLIVAAILVFIGLRPDPRDIGRELALLHPESVPRQGTRVLPEITSVHMKACDHPLSSISLVISAHTLGMYAFSILSGRMTDRWGRGQTIIVGAAVMIVSCLMAAPSTGLIPLMIALFLLGLGWNFAYVAGSALLADQLSPGERAKTQGFNDLMLNLTSAGSQVISGVVYAVGGYGVMSLAAAAAAVAPLILAIWWQTAGRHVAASRRT